MGAEARAGGRAVDLAIRFSEEWLMNWYRKHALQPSELEFWRRLFRLQVIESISLHVLFDYSSLLEFTGFQRPRIMDG